MNKTINILSVSPAIPPALLADVARAALPGIKVICTAPPGEVGTCQRYWIEGPDLWADVALEDHIAGFPPGMHAEGIVAMHPTRPPFLAAVLLTTLPRGMLAAAALGKPFTDAVADATREALRRGGFR